MEVFVIVVVCVWIASRCCVGMVIRSSFGIGVFVTTVYALYFRGKDGMYRYSEGMMSTFQIIGPTGCGSVAW